MDFIVASKEIDPADYPNIDASIVITTRNRRVDLLFAIASCMAQQGCRFEILLFDDASDDGTAQAVREKFPSVLIFANPDRMGLIHNRNRGFEEALGSVVFSIDDDAYFSSPDIVESVLNKFRDDYKIAAVAIPYIEPMNRRSLSSLQTPFISRSGDELSAYKGCAHAVRREVVLNLGGYREFFVHQGEERDLCLRMIAAGFRIVYGDKGLIVHMVSPNRQMDRVTYYGTRNRLLFDMLNLPVPDLLIRLIWDPVAIIRYRFSWSTLPLKLRGIVAGFCEGTKRWRERKPVSCAAYALFRTLPGHGPEEWVQAIPPPCALPESTR
jgi:GT2 family glycosyltransferase